MKHADRDPVTLLALLATWWMTTSRQGSTTVHLEEWIALGAVSFVVTQRQLEWRRQALRELRTLGASNRALHMRGGAASGGAVLAAYALSLLSAAGTGVSETLAHSATGSALIVSVCAFAGARLAVELAHTERESGGVGP